MIYTNGRGFNGEKSLSEVLTYFGKEWDRKVRAEVSYDV